MDKGQEIPTQRRGRARSPSAPHGEGACPHAPQAGRAVAPRPPPLVRLGDVCEIVSGSTPKTSVESYWGGSFPWITPAELNDNTVVVGDTARHLSEEGVASAALKPFPAGTVLLSSRAPIGKVAIAGCDMYCNQGFKNLICSDAIHNFYLYYWLKSHTSFLNSLGRGATFKEISKAIVAQIQIPLPPLPEQKRIAAILDKICEMKRNAEARLQKLDLLVKARFVEMFGDAIGSFFPRVALGDLCVVKSGGTPDRSMPEYWNNGTIPWVKTTELQNQKINRTSECITEKGLQESSAKLVPAGTILLAMYGQGKTRGMTAMLDIAAATNQACACIIPSEKVDNDYLWRYLILSYDKIRSQAQGAGQPNLNGQMVRSFLVPLPPLALQRQFAAFVEKVEGLKATAKKELEQVDLLYRAKLQEFFG